MYILNRGARRITIDKADADTLDILNRGARRITIDKADADTLENWVNNHPLETVLTFNYQTMLRKNAVKYFMTDEIVEIFERVLKQCEESLHTMPVIQTKIYKENEGLPPHIDSERSGKVMMLTLGKWKHYLFQENDSSQVFVARHGDIIILEGDARNKITHAVNWIDGHIYPACSSIIFRERFRGH